MQHAIIVGTGAALVAGCMYWRWVSVTQAKRFVVSGANKGIGLAIVRALVARDTFVFLCSRDVGRGEAAKAELVAENAAAAKLISVVQLDVTDAASVSTAAAAIKTACGGRPLDGLINNAGSADGMGYTGHTAFTSTIELNYTGTVRTTEAFLPLLSANGRIVMVSSGAAPSFVAKCSLARLKELTDPQMTTERIQALIDEAAAISATGGEKDKFQAAGLADGAPYGLSKAAMNCYTMHLARTNPTRVTNACSPGFIETDLTRGFAARMGKQPAEMGMLSVDKGAIAPVYLALDELPAGANGWYFGSNGDASQTRARVDSYLPCSP